MALIPFTIIIFLHIVGVFSPGGSTWGFNYWSLFARPVALGCLTAALLLLIPTVNSGPVSLLERLFTPLSDLLRKCNRIVVGITISLVLFAVLFFFRSRAHVYGDGFSILAVVADPGELKFFGQLYLQVLAILLHRVSTLGFESAWGVQAETAFAIVNSIGGVVGLWALYRISCLLGTGKVGRWFIFLGALTSGAVILFFGYIEHYTWATSLALWALYFSIRHVRGRGSAGKALLFALLAAGFHLIVLPYLAVVLLSIAIKKSFFDRLPFRMPFAILSAVVVFGSVVLVALAQLTDLPDVFVPLWPLPDNPYWALSWEHLKDVFNQAILVAPLGAAFLVFSFFVKESRRSSPTLEERILAGTSLLTILSSFWIDPELGAARDWDLLSFFGFPLSLWGVYRLTRLYPQMAPSGRWIAPIIIVGIIHLAPNLVEKNNLKLATRHLDQILWKSPHYQTSYQKARRALVWGTTLRNSVKEPDLALKYFYRRLSADSTCATSWFSIGDWFAKRKEYDSAAFYLRNMALQDAGNAGYLLKLAAVEAELGNLDRAVRIMQRCVSLAPDDYKVQYTAGLVASAAGHPDQALFHFRKAQQLDANSGRPMLNIGLIFLQRQQYDSAYLYLKEARQILPRDAGVYRPLLTAQVALGKLDEARQTFELYRKLNPDASLDSFFPSSD